MNRSPFTHEIIVECTEACVYPDRICDSMSTIGITIIGELPSGSHIRQVLRERVRWRWFPTFFFCDWGPIRVKGADHPLQLSNVGCSKDQHDSCIESLMAAERTVVRSKRNRVSARRGMTSVTLDADGWKNPDPLFEV